LMSSPADEPLALGVRRLSDRDKQVKVCGPAWAFVPTQSHGGMDSNLVWRC